MISRDRSPSVNPENSPIDNHIGMNKQCTLSSIIEDARKKAIQNRILQMNSRENEVEVIITLSLNLLIPPSSHILSLSSSVFQIYYPFLFSIFFSHYFFLCFFYCLSIRRYEFGRTVFSNNNNNNNNNKAKKY